MAGEWQEFEDDGWQEIPDVITLPSIKTPTTVNVGGYNIPMPKYTLPEINVSGNPRLPSFKGIVDASKNKIVYDERANTDYLKGVQESRGQAALDRAIEMQNMPGISHGDLFNKEFPYAHPLAFLGGMVSSANLLDTKAPYIHPVDFWKNNPQTKFMINAGRETDQLGYGVKNIGLFLKSVFGSSKQQDAALLEKNAMDVREADTDKVYQEMRENQGWGSLGATLPYLGTGAVTGPLSRYIAEQGLKVAGEVVAAPVRATTGRLARGVLQASEATGPIASRTVAPIARKIRTDFLDESLRLGQAQARQIPMPSRYRINIAKDIGGGGITGGFEGALHRENDPITGAIAGLTGVSGGKFLELPFLRAPVFWNEEQKRLADYFESLGGKLTPAGITGSEGMQRFEHGARNAPTVTDVFADIDRHNQKIFNREASAAVGMSNPLGESINPTVLRPHLEALSKDYQSLIPQITGELDIPSVLAIGNASRNLRGLRSTEGERAYKDVQAYMEQIAAMVRPQRAQGGRATGASFDGADYQRIRRTLKAEIDGAYAKGERLRGDSLAPLLRQLDEGVDRGALMYGGTATSEQLRILNERNALSELLMDKGLDINGNFDIDKLGSHFINNDARRYLTESGNPAINRLQMLVKSGHMLENQPGSALGTGGIRNKPSRGIIGAMVQLPVIRYGMGPLESIATKAYLSGYPSVKGLAGVLPRKVWGGVRGNRAFSIPQITRAQEQANKYKTDLITGGVNFSMNPAKSTKELMDRVFGGPAGIEP